LCNSEAIFKALEAVKGGDTNVLEGGTTYELDKSLSSAASGTESARIPGNMIEVKEEL
jgi:hypothetical protein